MVVIAHRLSTVQSADTVAVVAAGRVAEAGAHAELLGAGGAYAALVRRQLLGAGAAAGGQEAAGETAGGALAAVEAAGEVEAGAVEAGCGAPATVAEDAPAGLRGAGG